MEDCDATPVPWVHWLVFNIPPDTTTVSAGSIPAGGTEGIANGGTHGYEGPCPNTSTVPTTIISSYSPWMPHWIYLQARIKHM